MVAEIVASHSMLVKIFLAFLAAGFFIPKMTAKHPLKFRKASFVYTMIFQAIATMIAFTGVLAMVMGEYSFSLSIILMILIWAAMMYIEIKKYKVIKTADIKDPAKHTLLKSLFYKISAVQVFLVAVMVVLMIFKAKGLIAI
jgi:protein-S-isoprenylcysteine O-methyltransferase Ste14